MEYIQPELVVLVPVLMAIGSALKSSVAVWDENIPLILGCVGIFLAALWVTANALSSSTPINWPLMLFTAVVQGVLCAGASVGCHQAYKQKQDKHKEGD